MNNKKLIVIVVIILFVVVSLAIGLAILLKTPVVNNNNPPNSYPNQNITDSDEKNPKNYEYVLINNEDNIKLKTILGEELLINIEPKKWKEAKWSLKGSNVAALGETQSEVYNLFLYNLKEKKWIQVTNFEKNGVTSFDWIDNDTILFTEGGWLHRYKYSTLNEVVKIYQIEATLAALSPNRSTITLVDTNGTFYILSIDGKLLFSLNKIGIQNSEESISIKKVYYSRDSETLLFVTNDNKLYSWNLGDGNAKEISIPEQNNELASLNIICSLQVDKFEAFTLIDTTTVNFYTLDTLNNTLTLETNKLTEKPITNIAFNCLEEEDRLLFKLMAEDGNNWYQYKDSKIEKLVILDEAIEVDVKNKN